VQHSHVKNLPSGNLTTPACLITDEIKFFFLPLVLPSLKSIVFDAIKA